MKKIIYIFLIICFSRCDFSDNRLRVFNNTDKLISVGFLTDYSDTLLNSVYFYVRGNLVDPQRDTTFGIPSGIKRDGWIKEVRSMKDKMLHVYIFSMDTLEKYRGILTINEIVKQGLHDTIFKYSEAQLDSMNWRIVYE